MPGITPIHAEYDFSKDPHFANAKYARAIIFGDADFKYFADNEELVKEALRETYRACVAEGLNYWTDIMRVISLTTVQLKLAFLLLRSISEILPEIVVNYARDLLGLSPEVQAQMAELHKQLGAEAIGTATAETPVEDLRTELLQVFDDLKAQGVNLENLDPVSLTEAMEARGWVPFTFEGETAYARKRNTSKLSDEEVLEKMRADGLDPKPTAPAFDALLAEVESIIHTSEDDQP